MLVSLYYWLTLPIKAWYAPQSYRYHIEKVKGFGVLYLFGVLAVIWLGITSVWISKITMIREMLSQSYYTENDPAEAIPEALQLVHDIATQLPPIYIEDGSIYVKEAVPYIIYNSATQEPFMLIDTSTADADWQESKAEFLLTSKRLLMRNAQGSVTPLFDAATMQGEYIAITIPNIIGWLENIETLQGGMWLWGVGVALLAAMSLSFCYSLLNQCIARYYYERHLTLSQAMRLSTLSLTPALMLYHLGLVVPWLQMIPLFGLIMMLLPMAYSAIMLKRIYQYK